MDTISYTNLRENLAQTLEKVRNDHAPVAITQKSETPVVMMSMEDYQSLQETAYLLRSPANAKRLMESITELDNSKGSEKDLAE